MRVYQIDVYPEAKVDGILRSKEDGVGGYKSFRYTTNPEGPFNLSAILYNGRLLPMIPPSIVSVKNVVTYFNNGGAKLLLIHLALDGGTHTYYMNQDTKLGPESVTFSRFGALGPEDLKSILGNITKYGGLNVIELNKEHNDLAKKLIGGAGVAFDLTKKPWTLSKYTSLISGKGLDVIDLVSISRFTKVKYALDSGETFELRGIVLPDGKCMQVRGGFPNDLFQECYVYYGDDQNYDKPLLATLKVKSPSNTFRDIGWHYYLSRTLDLVTWDIRRICHGLDDVKELPRVLDNIKQYSRLDFAHLDQNIKDKLGDVRGGLIIDLEKATRGAPGKVDYYSSDGVYIPYMMETGQVEGYHVIRHAILPYFTMNRMRIDAKTELSEDRLPPLGTLFSKLNVYYKDSPFKTPVLIELTVWHDSSNDEYPMNAYYYCKEGAGWQGYLLTTTVGEGTADTKNLIKSVRNGGDKIILGSLTAKLAKYKPVETKVKRAEEDKSVPDVPQNETEKGTTAEESKSEQKPQPSERSRAIGYTVAAGACILTIGTGLYIGWPSLARASQRPLFAKL